MVPRTLLSFFPFPLSYPVRNLLSVFVLFSLRHGKAAPRVQNSVQIVLAQSDS